MFISFFPIKCVKTCSSWQTLTVYLFSQVFTYFMSTKPQSWKDKYVSGYVALAGPLGGASKVFRVIISGKTTLTQHAHVCV